MKLFAMPKVLAVKCNAQEHKKKLSFLQCENSKNKIKEDEKLKLLSCENHKTPKKWVYERMSTFEKADEDEKI